MPRVEAPESFTIATLLIKLPIVDPSIPVLESCIKITIKDKSTKSIKSKLGTSHLPQKKFKVKESPKFKKYMINIPSTVFPGEI